MNAQVSIRFGPGLMIEYSVPFASDAAAQERARAWLDRAYDEFGCVPIRPSRLATRTSISTLKCSAS